MISRAERKRRADFILKELETRYPDPKPPLDHQDAFTFLVAVALSAQTTDARVNLVTPSLFRAAPDPWKMSELGAAGILNHIKTCGLAPTKARNIERLSRILCDQYNGQVPASFEELEALPGVGHKTASVVMSQIFKVPALPVDTHVFRLARRWKLSRGESVEKTERDLKEYFPETHWAKISLQIIFYGREHCTARGCDGQTCPICKTLNGRSVPRGSLHPKKQKSSPQRPKSSAS